MSGQARAVVLGRVRAALAGGGSGPPASAPAPAPTPTAAIARAYRQAGRVVPSEALTARFCERVDEYRARVQRTAAGSLDDVVAGLLAGRRVLVAPAAPCVAVGYEAIGDDPPLASRELAAADAVLTGCALAVAETGTIVLDGTAACGRRALTLVVDHHVCVVHAGQIVADVPDAIAALRRTGAVRRPITLVSGPSATSDIELERVEGVHGPRRLDVVVVADGPTART
jgi:L-lactate dehydrogenase complex protein LldG